MAGISSMGGAPPPAGAGGIVHCGGRYRPGRTSDRSPRWSRSRRAPCAATSPRARVRRTLVPGSVREPTEPLGARRGPDGSLSVDIRGVRSMCSGRAVWWRPRSRPTSHARPAAAPSPHSSVVARTVLAWCSHTPTGDHDDRRDHRLARSVDRRLLAAITALPDEDAAGRFLRDLCTSASCATWRALAGRPVAALGRHYGAISREPVPARPRSPASPSGSTRTGGYREALAREAGLLRSARACSAGAPAAERPPTPEAPARIVRDHTHEPGPVTAFGAASLQHHRPRAPTAGHPQQGPHAGALHRAAARLGTRLRGRHPRPGHACVHLPSTS